MATAAKDEEKGIRETLALSIASIQSNSLSFIDRLHTEILEAIFIRCACDYHRTASGDPIPHAPSWVNVSYVSRRWRSVALDYPALWTYLFVTSPRWTTELLARSKQAPLKLYMKLHPRGKKYGLRFVEEVMNHVQRVQEFRLHLRSGCYEVLSELSSCAPLLQSLEISIEHSHSNWSSVPFDGDTPSLRTLELTRCPVPWYSFKQRSRLTMLRLCHVPVEFQQTIEQFLVMLRYLQDLTHLHLVDALASDAFFLSSAAFRALQEISLPHLSRLLIAASSSTAVALLSCINIPLKAQVSLDCSKDKHSTPDDYLPLCLLLAQRFSMSEDQALYSQTIRSLIIVSSRQEGYTTITFSRSERKIYPILRVPVLATDWDCNIPLQITLAHGELTTGSSWERIIGHICCPVPLSNVQRVHVFSPPLSRVFWTHVLGHLQDLRYLKLDEGDMPPIASILSLAPHDCMRSQGGYPNLGGNEMFVPALEELELFGISFSRPWKRGADPLEATDVQSLCDALSTRKDTRLRLTMTRCFEPTEDVFDMTSRWEDGRFCTERGDRWAWAQSMYYFEREFFRT